MIQFSSKNNLIKITSDYYNKLNKSYLFNDDNLTLSKFIVGFICFLAYSN